MLLQFVIVEVSMDDPFLTAFRYLLESKGLTQERIALDAKISQPYLNQILNGRKPGRVSTRERIAVALGTDLQEMMAIGKSLQRGGPPTEYRNPRIAKILQMLTRFDDAGDDEAIEKIFRIAEDRAEVAELRKEFYLLKQRTGTNE